MLYVLLLSIAFIVYFSLTDKRAKPFHLDIAISTVAAMLIIAVDSKSTGSFFRMSNWDFRRDTNIDDFLIYSIAIFVILLLLRKFVQQSKE